MRRTRLYRDKQRVETASQIAIKATPDEDRLRRPHRPGGVLGLAPQFLILPGREKPLISPRLGKFLPPARPEMGERDKKALLFLSMS